MTKKELIEAIKMYPDDSIVNIEHYDMWPEYYQVEFIKFDKDDGIILSTEKTED